MSWNCCKLITTQLVRMVFEESFTCTTSPVTPQVSSPFYDLQILSGLEKIPTARYPGTLVVTGDAQPVFAAKSAGDTFLAACHYGNGRVFVAAHGSYIDWLDSTESVKEAFNKNVKRWLTVNRRTSSPHIKIGDLDHVLSQKESLNSYDILTWNSGCAPSPSDLERVLAHVENGGALFCGVTPWGYLQTNPTKTLNDMALYRFLREYTGILLTKEIIYLCCDELPVSENKAKHSHFDIAIEQIGNSPQKIEKYSNTICNGMDILKKEELLDNDKIMELMSCLQTHCSVNEWNVVPEKKKPIKKAEQKSIARLMCKCLLHLEGQVAPGIESFPGQFQDSKSIYSMLEEDVDLRLSSRFCDELVSTGYYLPAGVSLLINIVSCDSLNHWTCQIGSHTDDLSDCDSYARWPCVVVEQNLKCQETTVNSPFGGLVYFKYNGPDRSVASHIEMIITNVVKSPYYDLTDNVTVSNWNEQRTNAKGIWSELAGRHIIFTVPSHCIRNLNDPRPVLEFWDQVVSTHHKCRGTCVDEFKRERVVCDIQPVAGYMHSGYPIVTHLDICETDSEDYVFNIERLRQYGKWGLFHELGHNMQRSKWTFDGSGEVTVNIFSMHAFEMLLGQKVTEQRWPRDCMEDFPKYFSKQPTFEDWKDNFGMALMTFAQLIKHFGWQPMYKFMSDYENDLKTKSNLPKKEQDKIDQWVIRYSKIVGKNLKPHFEMWGLPVSDDVEDELDDLEPWCKENEKDPAQFFSS